MSVDRGGIAVFGLVLALLLGAATAVSGERFSPQVKACLYRVSAHVYNDEFDRALTVLDSLQNHSAPAPVCRLFHAITFQAQMMAAESDFLKDDFFILLDSLIDDGQALLARGRDSALAYWLIGNSHAFRSLFLGRSGNILGALRHGLAARSAYTKAYAADPHFHDIALGLGSYRYWKSVKTAAVNWTPLFKNERREGINLLRLAGDSAEVSADAATAALIWVYINEKRYIEAIRLSRQMLRKYPYGLAFHWALGESYRGLGDYRGAADVYEGIMDRLKANPGNYYNIIEAAYYLSECYRKSDGRNGEMPAKLEALKAAVAAMSIPEETRKRQKSKINDILGD
jgi:tetratricopeptide (TPR) repeat protein